MLTTIIPSKPKKIYNRSTDRINSHSKLNKRIVRNGTESNSAIERLLRSRIGTTNIMMRGDKKENKSHLLFLKTLLIMLCTRFFRQSII